MRKLSSDSVDWGLSLSDTEEAGRLPRSQFSSERILLQGRLHSHQGEGLPARKWLRGEEATGKTGLIKAREFCLVGYILQKPLWDFLPSLIAVEHTTFLFDFLPFFLLWDLPSFALGFSVWHLHLVSSCLVIQCLTFLLCFLEKSKYFFGSKFYNSFFLVIS